MKVKKQPSEVAHFACVWLETFELHNPIKT